MQQPIHVVVGRVDADTSPYGSRLGVQAEWDHGIDRVVVPVPNGDVLRCQVSSDRHRRTPGHLEHERRSPIRRIRWTNHTNPVDRVQAIE